MRLNKKTLFKAIHASLTVGVLGAVGVTGTAVAQQDQERTLDRIEVTGSRLKRAEVEGSVPVTVFDREQLDVSGDFSVADFLRNTSFNSFGSFRPQSGSSAQSFAGISLRGLGVGRTLVLIDGRRAPVAPNVGSAQDLNIIPMAAVERIEVLTDGASAVYGTDAIGGVVNIILRKDYDGAEISYGFSSPKRTGGDEEEGSILLGVTSDRGRLLVGASYNDRDIVWQRDRHWSDTGASTFSNNFVIANPANNALGWTSSGIFLNNPTYGSVVPGGCSDPDFFTGFANTAAGPRETCYYDFAAVGADEAEVKNRALFARGDYQLNDDWSTYLAASVSRVKSFGRYAPVPSSPWPGGLPFLPVGSPNHPAVRFPDAGYDPDTPYYFAHRFAALGNRDTSVDANVYDVLVGFEGRVGNVDLDFGVRRSDSVYTEIGRNYVVAAIAQQFISDGRYDIYAPSANPQDIMNAMIAAPVRDARFTLSELFASATFDLFELPGGVASAVIGAEYRDEYYQDIYDSLSEGNQIVGSSGSSAAGSRDVTAAYVEALFPILSNLEVNLAVRHDDYSDYGSDTSPKVSLRFQPFDSLTLRASYGEGFAAPSLDILSQQPSFGAASLTHAPTCIALGLAPSCTVQVTTYSIANPNLESEQAKQWSAGFAWDAFDWLNLTLDYYNIKITNQIAGIGIATVVGCLEGTLVVCPPGLSVLPVGTSLPNAGLGLGAIIGPDGQVLGGQTGFTNLGEVKTYGVDFNLRTNFDLGAAGQLRNQLQITNPLHYSGSSGVSVVGRESYPRYRGTLSNLWSLGDFSFAWNINYIHGQQSNAYRNTLPPNFGSDYGYAHRLPSWTTHDLQASYQTPWNGRISLGVTNVADKDPVLDPFDPTGRGYRFNLYDGYGRVPYFRYTQKF